jgi:hypothetical protein
MATSARIQGLPAPSSTRPLRITTSYSVSALAGADTAGVGEVLGDELAGRCDAPVDAQPEATTVSATRADVVVNRRVMVRRLGKANELVGGGHLATTRLGGAASTIAEQRAAPANDVQRFVDVRHSLGA